VPVTDPRLEAEFQTICREGDRCKDVAFDLEFGINKLAQDDEMIDALADIALQMATQTMTLLAAIAAFRRAGGRAL
jgi:hypothetical protein